MKLPQIALTGPKKTSTVTVEDSVFGGKVNWTLLTQAVEAYRANQRRAHAKKQTRSEVSLTKSKWYRQKGTGRARHGAKSANIFVGGGLAHGPKGIQNFKRQLSTKMKRAALASALAAQTSKQKVMIATGGTEFTGRTPEAKDALLRISQDEKQSVLVIVSDDYKNFLQASKNIKRMQLTRADRVNALEIANANLVVVMKESLPVLSTRIETKTKDKSEDTPVKQEK